jgi:cell division protein FtsQ
MSRPSPPRGAAPARGGQPAAGRRPPTDRRIAARRKAIAAARVRRRRRQLGLAALALLLAFGLVRLAHSPLLGLSAVHVEGARVLDPAEVVAAARLRPGQPYLGIDLGVVRRRVAALPWVARVQVAHDYPSSLRIRLVERTPAGSLSARGRYWLVSADGVVLAASATRPRALPYVADVPVPAGIRAGTRLPPGNPLANALSALGGLRPELARQVAAVTARSLDSLTLRLRGGATVLYGLAADQPAKDAAVLLVQRKLATQKRRLVSIDVRTPSAPTVVAADDKSPKIARR